MTRDEIAELAFATLVICRRRGITDPLRQAHAIAVAVEEAQRDPYWDHSTGCRAWAGETCNCGDGKAP